MKRLNLTKKKKIILAVVLVLAVGAVVFMLTRDKKEEAIKKAEPGKKYYSLLTGVEVSKDVTEEPILGVMIENSLEARPQTGLDNAGIVFETTAEAGITRYLALFQENKPAEVGPVRSVRPAYVDWAMGFDASIAHVGGSEAGLKLIDERQAKSMNEFYNGGSYYRRNDREAPHDAYAKTSSLVALQKEKGHKAAKFEPFARSNDAPAQTPTATVITLAFSHPDFTSAFTYDKASNGYLRSLAGQPHIDQASGKQISVKNLIVIVADIQDGALGSGQATLYKDGTAYKIRWEQKSFSERIKFLDENGNSFGLNRGDTWVSVVPTSGTVSAQ